MARASRSNRAFRSGEAVREEFRTLMATVRSRRVSRALYTSPMPPAPMGDWISYGPSFVPEVRAIRARHYSLCSKAERAHRFCMAGQQPGSSSSNRRRPGAVPDCYSSAGVGTAGINCAGHAAEQLLLRVADQHDIGLAVATDDGELLTVIRVVEIADEFGLEVGELLSRRTIQMLQPEVIGLPVANGVNDARAVAAEQDGTVAKHIGVLDAGTLAIQKPDWLAEIERQEPQLLPGVAGAIGDHRRELSVR